MTDKIVVQVPSFLSVIGSDLNIQQITVADGRATILLSTPDLSDDHKIGYFDFFLEHSFVGSSDIELIDQTSGVTYKLSKAIFDGYFYYSATGPTTITFPVTSVDPPIEGTIYGNSPCFATGTHLSTPSGSTAVEDLLPGDNVTTLVGPAVITWIGHRRARDADVIRIRVGTLGAQRDLIVSDDHALYVDGSLVPAGLLVDGAGIVRERRQSVTFWHLELERHGILFAEGVLAESYLDTGNRHQFGNCPIAYDPVLSTADPFAEMVLAGSRLEEVRAMLQSHASV